jgi:hypothetical protein
VSWFSPFIETCTRTKLSWVTMPVVHGYAEVPPVEDYATLIAQFARSPSA